MSLNSFFSRCSNLGVLSLRNQKFSRCSKCVRFIRGGRSGTATAANDVPGNSRQQAQNNNENVSSLSPPKKSIPLLLLAAGAFIPALFLLYKSGSFRRTQKQEFRQQHMHSDVDNNHDHHGVAGPQLPGWQVLKDSDGEKEMRYDDGHGNKGHFYSKKWVYSGGNKQNKTPIGDLPVSESSSSTTSSSSSSSSSSTHPFLFPFNHQPFKEVDEIFNRLLGGNGFPPSTEFTVNADSMDGRNFVSPFFTHGFGTPLSIDRGPGTWDQQPKHHDDPNNNSSDKQGKRPPVLL